MVLKVKVIPRSPRSEIAGTMDDGTLKIRIAAVAEKGRANAELCSFLAKHYGVAKDSVAIISGATSPLKTVRIG